MSKSNDQIEPSRQAIAQQLNSCPSLVAQKRRTITREEIKAALKKVYADETKPVNVGSIKVRTGFALLLISLGAIIVSGMIGIKYLALELSIMIFGIILLLITFSTGFIISTKNIRKIYRSMKRFQDNNTPSYRTVLPKSSFKPQGLIYATLLCVILLGAQAVNFQILTNNYQEPNDYPQSEDQVAYEDGMIWLDDVILGEAEKALGQYYRQIVVEINNTIKYYGDNLVLEILSYFAGDIFDEVNMTLNEPKSDIKVAPIKIHEPDDTTIFANLIYNDGHKDQLIDQEIVKAENDIYITSAKGKVTKTSPITKSIDITVVIYNEGMIPRAPEEVSVIILTPSFFGSVYRDSAKNNETIGFGEFWEVKFKLDNIIDETVFDVELKIDETTKDDAEVLSG